MGRFRVNQHCSICRSWKATVNMKGLLITCVLVGLFGRGFAFLGGLGKVKTVDELDLTKYMGRWYEMYNSLIQRQTFQKDSFCTTADYTLKTTVQWMWLTLVA